MKRVFLIVLDSVGIGEMPDAAEFGDQEAIRCRRQQKAPVFPCRIWRSLGCFRLTEWNGRAR